MSIDFGSCAARETLVVTTRASVYELIVLRGDEGDVLVRGGSHFTDFRRVLFVGSTADGGSFHARIIDIALRMQFICEDRFISTSAVQSLSRHPASTTSTESAYGRNLRVLRRVRSSRVRSTRLRTALVHGETPYSPCPLTLAAPCPVLRCSP